MCYLMIVNESNSAFPLVSHNHGSVGFFVCDLDVYEYVFQQLKRYMQMETVGDGHLNEQTAPGCD